MNIDNNNDSKNHDCNNDNNNDNENNIIDKDSWDSNSDVCKMKFIPKNDKNSVKKKWADREKMIRNKYLNISENEGMLVLFNFEECFQF